MRHFALPKIPDLCAEGSEGTEASTPNCPALLNLIVAVWPGYKSNLPEDIAIDELSDDTYDENVGPRMKRQQRKSLTSGNPF